MGSENERRRSKLGDEEVRMKMPKVGGGRRGGTLITKCSLSPERETVEEASGFTLKAI